MANSLREAVRKCCSTDPQKVVKCLEACNIPLTPEDKACFAQCRLEKFSDSKLEACFSPKVCGMLGIKNPK